MGTEREDLESVIRLLESLTASLSRAGPSEDLAHRWNELGQAYYQSSSPDTLGDARRASALECYLKALEIFSSRGNPKWWAAVHFNMGHAFCDMQRDRSANVERAIESYERALEVYKEKSSDFRYDWATAQYELGLAYDERRLGSKRENLLASIEHYREALKVFSRREFADEYACAQQNLAAALSDLANIP
jgi:tetratricopeptide (TPR) repeat protein